MTRIYKQTVLAKNSASVGDQSQAVFTYKGFSSSAAKKSFKLYDIDIVKQDLINHFYIRKGEKLENPNFGTAIWDILFEPFTPEVKELLAKDVQSIINYDPRLIVTDLQIDSTDFGIRIQADLLYVPFNINERITLSFDKANKIIN